MRASRSKVLAGAIGAVLTAVCVGAAPAKAASLPPGAVATVGGEPVTIAQFKHWRRIAAEGEGVDPPTFRRCIAAGRRRARKLGRHPSRRALRVRCARRYAATRGEAMSFLIDALWIRQEAAARGISVSDAEVRRRFAALRRGAFTGAEYRRYLRSTSMTETDLLLRVRLDELQLRITRAVGRAAPPVTPEDVSRYHASHRKRFRRLTRAQARRRIRRILRARSEMRAIERFVRDFRRRSKAKTVCASGYVVRECGSSEPAGPAAIRHARHRA